MFYYVKPEKRLLHIKRNLKQDEIDYEKIAIDESIPLKIEFFKNNWREIRFEVILTALSERYTEKEVREFLLTEIPQQIIFDNLIYFVDKEFTKYIKGINLNGLHPNFLREKLGDSLPVALAYFVNQGNLDHVKAFRMLFYNNEISWEERKQFLNEVNNRFIFMDTLALFNENPDLFNRKQLAYVEEIYYNKYPHLFEESLVSVKYNIKLKGVLWIKLIWRGLKNIVQKVSANLFSLMKQSKQLLINGINKAK